MINLGFTYLKKIIVFLILTCFMLGIMSSNAVFADDINEGEPDEEVFLSIAAGKSTNSPIVNATAAIVMDMDSGRILYSKNAESRRAIASTTKIMSECCT
jgi:D-alanyl-D-alanine carboxypeptidase (penicillin-binding protein 5/6)